MRDPVQIFGAMFLVATVLIAALIIATHGVGPNYEMVPR